MGDATDRQAMAGEKLAAVFTALSRCGGIWTDIAKQGQNVELTSSQALEIAEFFMRSAGDVASATMLLGFGLIPVPPTSQSQTPAKDQAKPRLSVIEGGKS